jgi:hypothetical protein
VKAFAMRRNGFSDTSLDRARSEWDHCTVTGESTDVIVRLATVGDLPFIQRMLYEAANRPGDEWPSFEASMSDDRNRRFWMSWQREGDIGIVAEYGSTPVGAAWIRSFSGSDLPPIDDPDIQVLAIGIEETFRSQGIGGLMMNALGLAPSWIEQTLWHSRWSRHRNCTINPASGP